MRQDDLDARPRPSAGASADAAIGFSASTVRFLGLQRHSKGCCLQAQSWISHFDAPLFIVGLLGGGS